jgi:hypothetical protein
LGTSAWALHEETLVDHNFGRVMNANIAEYHVPVNADVYDIKVIFVDEPDADHQSARHQGLGEIGIVGVAAAIANAVYHATANVYAICPSRWISCSGDYARTICRRAEQIELRMNASFTPGSTASCCYAIVRRAACAARLQRSAP